MMQKFTPQIGHKVWASGKEETSSIFLWSPFLVIGKRHETNLNILLMDRNFVLESGTYVVRCTQFDLEFFQIESQYLGRKIAYIHDRHVCYLGGLCKKCYEPFEHLAEYSSFVCWKCEL